MYHFCKYLFVHPSNAGRKYLFYTSFESNHLDTFSVLSITKSHIITMWVQNKHLPKAGCQSVPSQHLFLCLQMVRGQLLTNWSLDIWRWTNGHRGQCKWSVRSEKSAAFEAPAPSRGSQVSVSCGCLALVGSWGNNYEWTDVICSH